MTLLLWITLAMTLKMITMKIVIVINNLNNSEVSSTSGYHIDSFDFE